MQKHYSVEITNHKVAFAVYVNDILLSTNRNHSKCTNEFPVNQYVYNGENSLRLNISINPNWFEELKEQKARVRIIESSGTGGSFAERDVTDISWQWDDTVQFPVNISKQFTLGIPYGNWVWREADTLTEENLRIAPLHEYLRNLHDSLNEKNYEKLERFLRYKSADLANAFYIPIKERLADQRNFFENDLFGTDGWGLDALDLSNLMLDFQANGKLLRIVKSNGKSPIISKPLSDSIFELELLLCFKNNEWILCR